jgi:hypothetical protein
MTTPPTMHVYELEIRNDDYRLLHHIRAVDEDDAVARGLAHWQRPIVRCTWRRQCKPWEVEEQIAKDKQPRPDPNDVRVVVNP